jgi:hypothetical protein
VGGLELQGPLEVAVLVEGRAGAMLLLLGFKVVRVH